MTGLSESEKMVTEKIRNLGWELEFQRRTVIGVDGLFYRMIFSGFPEERNVPFALRSSYGKLGEQAIVYQSGGKLFVQSFVANSMCADGLDSSFEYGIIVRRETMEVISALVETFAANFTAVKEQEKRDNEKYKPIKYSY